MRVTKECVVRAAGVLGALAALSFTAPAQAALTTSEKAQVRDFAAAAQLENAGRVRALVARTDLSEAESIAVLSEALEGLPFDTARGRFLKEIVFGPSSAPSRPLLALAAVRAVLARADAVHQKYVGGLDHEPKALGELAALYAFLDGEVANAGRTSIKGHDPLAGIPASTYEACSKALRDHVDRNARWLKGDGPVADPVARVRAQAQVALRDMLPDGATARVEAADRLGLKGPRRQMLLDWDLLVADAGHLDEASLEKVRRALARMPGARADTSVLFLGDPGGAIRARGAVVTAGGHPPRAGASPFGDELTPAPYDAAVGTVLLDLATIAARRVLETKPDFRAQVEKDVAAAAQADAGRTLGLARGTSAAEVLGGAVQALFVDAPRAVDLAMVRHVAGRPESVALLSDALGVAILQVGGDTLELGRNGAPVAVTGVKVAPNGAVLGFTLEGAAWTIDRAQGSYAVVAARRGGQPVSLLHLASAKTPMREGDRWAEADLAFTRVRGTPRVGIVPQAPGAAGPTVKLVGGGTSAKGYDAIGMTTPDDDVVVEGDLTVRGGPGGIGFRLGNGRDAVRGAMLVVAPGTRTSILVSDEVGFESLLAAPIEPAVETPVHVKITVRGTKISATVGATKLEGTLPATLSKGDVGLVARPGASVDVTGFSVKKAR